MILPSIYIPHGLIMKFKSIIGNLLKKVTRKENQGIINVLILKRVLFIYLVSLSTYAVMFAKLTEYTCSQKRIVYLVSKVIMWIKT